MRNMNRACTAALIAVTTGMAWAQPIVPASEPYNVVWFGSNSTDGFLFAPAFGNTVVNFDGVTQVANGQPTNLFGAAVGDPTSYNVTESVFSNGDGTWTIRVEVSSDAPTGFLAPGLNFDPFGTAGFLDTFTFDLGATTFGTNNGIRTVSNDIQIVSADIAWLAGGQTLFGGDVLQRIQISLGAGIDSLATGTGLRGQFSVIAPGEDIGSFGLNHMILDMVVVPAPSVPAVIALSSLAIAARRRRS